MIEPPVTSRLDTLEFVVGDIETRLTELREILYRLLKEVDWMEIMGERR